MAPEAPAALFVYGTLMPGRLRWPLVELEVTATREATLAGTLLDTGRGYPALVLDGGGEVHGWVLELDPARLDGVLAELDRIEGPEYARVTASTADGSPVQTYVFLGDPSGCTSLPDGRWPEGTER